MEQKTFELLKEFLKLNFVVKGSREQIEKINLDETMKRIRLQTRLRQQRTMAISDFEAGKRTFIHLLFDNFSVNEKTLPSFLSKIGFTVEEKNKAISNLSYLPSFDQLMKMFLILEFTELEANQWSEELGYLFKTWEYRDLIVLFCLRNHIHKYEDVLELMKFYQLPPW